MSPRLDTLLERFDAGDKRALARLISIVEDQRPDARAVLDRLFPRVGKAWRVGITGPPGAGKSTLVDRLTSHWVAAGARVGILAVDPTSPFSGGALLGDRIRMGPDVDHERVFFRSLASRGSLGGLSLHASEVADVLDASGCTHVLMETVGVGQSELDVAGKAHTVVVVLVPESGDGIQVMKAGLMEIADVFVVNKADRPGADKLAREIGAMLDLDDARAWRPPVVTTRAQEGEGVPALAEAVAAHRTWMQQEGRAAVKQRRALESRVRDLVESSVLQRLWSAPAVDARLQEGLEAIGAGRSTPYRLAAQLETLAPAALADAAARPNACEGE